MSMTRPNSPGIFAKLFYSIMDDDFFVAIQDSRSKEIITILPIEYADGQGWVFGDNDKDLAKERFFGESVPILQNLLDRDVLVVRKDLELERKKRAEYSKYPEYWVNILVDVTNIPTRNDARGSYTFLLGEFPREFYPSIHLRRRELLPLIMLKIQKTYEFHVSRWDNHLKRVMVTATHCFDQKIPLLVLYPDDFKECVRRYETL